MASERPRLLDLYCGGGGAGKGYEKAGFDVTGVDHRPQPRYPFAFVQADALDYCARHGREFDFIHASPPCQRYSVTRSLHANEHPDLVPATRDALIATGRPYVIENVVGAPLHEPIMLCGQMFGLALYRHRLFECSFFLLTPPHPGHLHRTTGNSRQSWAEKRDNVVASVCGNGYLLAHGKRAMDIDWLPRKELSQAIPPAYTRFIGAAWLTADGRGGDGRWRLM